MFCVFVKFFYGFQRLQVNSALDKLAMYQLATGLSQVGTSQCQHLTNSPCAFLVNSPLIHGQLATFEWSSELSYTLFSTKT